jgi:surfactin synthase thioesterase subunit
MQTIDINGFSYHYDSMSIGDPKVNIVAICGCGGGFSGPAYLYDNIIKNPFNNITFTRIDIAYPYVKGSIYSSKLHFNHSVDAVVLISKMIYATNSKPIVLIGWSMGGAVVIESGCKLQSEIKIHGIFTIATQLAHIKNLNNLNDEIFKVFIHGDKDNVLNHSLSELLYKQVKTRKMIQIIKDGDHFLSGNEVYLYELIKNVIKSII